MLVLLKYEGTRLEVLVLLKYEGTRLEVLVLLKYEGKIGGVIYGMEVVIVDQNITILWLKFPGYSNVLRTADLPGREKKHT